jgi:hypothetical protein
VYFDPEARLCFLASPRTGSHAVADALESEYTFRTPRHHARLGGRWEPQPPLAPGWLVLVGIRNHFDAVCSWLSHQPDWEGENVDAAFVEYIINGGPRSYTSAVRGRLWGFHLYGIEDRLSGATLRLLRQETLQADLNRALTEHGTPRVRLRRKNVTRGRRPYQEMVTDCGRRAIEHEWGAEMIELGYRWEDG